MQKYKEGQLLDELKSMAARYIARSKRFDNGGAAFNVICGALECWADRTGEDPSRLAEFFETKPDGRFVLSFLNH